MNNKEKEKKAWAEIIERAWKDENFKQRLFSNTEEVLKEYNLPVPKNAHYKLIEETPNEVMIVFPQKPEHVSDEELKNIAAAAGLVALEQTHAPLAANLPNLGGP